MAILKKVFSFCGLNHSRDVGGWQLGAKGAGFEPVPRYSASEWEFSKNRGDGGGREPVEKWADKPGLLSRLGGRICGYCSHTGSIPIGTELPEIGCAGSPCRSL